MSLPARLGVTFIFRLANTPVASLSSSVVSAYLLPALWPVASEDETDDTDPVSWDLRIRDRLGACVPGVRSREDGRRTVLGGERSKALAGGGDGVRREVLGESIVGRVGTGHL